jgi:hypothetical protein
LPRDQHRHDRGLAAAGRHLQSDAKEFRVRLLVGTLQMLAELVVAAFPPGNFRQPDGGLDRLHLAEEWPDGLELVVTPVGEQALGCRGNAPVVGIRNPPPGFEMLAKFVDHPSWVVLLVLGRKVLGVGKDEAGLGRLTLLLPRFGHRRDELGSSASGDGGPIQRLAVVVQGMVPGWRVVRRVQDRMLEKARDHGCLCDSYRIEHAGSEIQSHLLLLANHALDGIGRHTLDTITITRGKAHCRLGEISAGPMRRPRPTQGPGWPRS